MRRALPFARALAHERPPDPAVLLLDASTPYMRYTSPVNLGQEFARCSPGIGCAIAGLVETVLMSLWRSAAGEERVSDYFGTLFVKVVWPLFAFASIPGYIWAVTSGAFRARLIVRPARRSAA